MCCDRSFIFMGIDNNLRNSGSSRVCQQSLEIKLDLNR